ncbi:nucleotidyltransferase domain-containing protein [Collinsella tanakaei]|uniref:nucleotidyltransferase family protein n=1 Tax=Collinsella tanakaei TaxID=626935 RepID=UPI00195785F2|nr:nucleotidyltransferase domain-containing protein [Collinsella tanakaei]MBM6778357.1 nucleotidyltransferase domain-containing protein [Collinsella tanakaei]
MTTRDAIQAAFSNILKDYDVKEAYVFGSYARGDQTPDSDVDVRLLCGSGMTYGALYDIQLALQRQLGCDVDIVSAKPHQMRSSFYDSIKDEEVLLYEAG